MIKLKIIKVLEKLITYMEDITYVDPVNYLDILGDTKVLVGYKRDSKNCPMSCVVYGSVTLYGDKHSFSTVVTNPASGCSYSRIQDLDTLNEYDLVEVTVPTYDEWYAEYRAKERALYKKRDLEGKKGLVNNTEPPVRKGRV